MGYDPIALSKITKELVCYDLKRKYYRFRDTRFYGGSATADVVGCNLRCLYCWSWKYVTQPQRYGKLYSPVEVAQRLNTMGGKIARLSGGEPLICFDHLIEVISLVRKPFILETNGILLDKEKVRILRDFNVFVRISLKGVDRETFAQITGADGKFFEYQIKALELLAKEGVPARPAITFNLFPSERVDVLQRRLLEISPAYVLELEPFVDYGGALERLKRAGIRPWSF